MEAVRAQTPLFLQEALKKEIEKITSDLRFMKPESNQRVPLHVFAQKLPIPQPIEEIQPPGNSIEFVG